MNGNQERTENAPGLAQARRNSGEIIRPPVDVYEDASGINVLSIDSAGIPIGR